MGQVFAVDLLLLLVHEDGSVEDIVQSFYLALVTV